MKRKKAATHHCHLPGCATPCPRAHLFCARHWAMVPAGLQQEVMFTVGLRGRRVDETWAPWWRAQANAIATVLRLLTPKMPPDREAAITMRLDHALRFADLLETRKIKGTIDAKAGVA